MKLVSLILSLILSSVSWAGPKVSLDPTRTILLSGPIGGEAMDIVIHAANKLAKEDKEKPIDIVLDSPGGSLIAGYLMIDKIEHLKAQGVKFRCFVHSVAASMAFQTLLHCNERYATPHAVLLWHPVRVFWRGPLTEADATRVAAGIKVSNKIVLEDLKKRLTSISEENLLYHFETETLHQASALAELAPKFFDYIGYDIENLFETKGLAASTAGIFFSQRNEIMYIHERFIALKEDISIYVRKENP